jgi:hypothetical protein
MLVPAGPSSRAGFTSSSLLRGGWPALHWIEKTNAAIRVHVNCDVQMVPAAQPASWKCNMNLFPTFSNKFSTSIFFSLHYRAQPEYSMPQRSDGTWK